MSFDLNQIPSPCYLLEEEKLIANLELLKRVQKEADCKIILALKGFAMWSSFDLVKDYLPGCTASSLYELKLADEKFGRENHIYSAAYREDEFDETCRLAGHIVFNSVNQWNQFSKRAIAAGVSCGIRVNPGIAEVDTDLYNPCFSGSRLGVRPEHLKGAELSGIEGMHAHALCENLADSSVALIDAFEEKFSDYIPWLKWVNFGGGHLITHAGYDVGKQAGQLGDFTPAQIAAFKGLLAGGAGCRNLAEVGTGAQFGDGGIGLALCRFHLLGAGRFGQRDENMRQAVFISGRRLLLVGGEKVADFLFGDVDALLDGTLDQLADDHFTTDIFTEDIKVHARV